MEMNHRHVILQLTNVKKPLESSNEWNEWLEDIITSIDMKILSGPHISYCDTKGNEGWSGICMIETSHISFHYWENSFEPTYLNMDLYSCKDFDLSLVLVEVLKLNPSEISWIEIDRNNSEPVTLNKQRILFNEY